MVVNQMCRSNLFSLPKKRECHRFPSFLAALNLHLEHQESNIKITPTGAEAAALLSIANIFISHSFCPVLSSEVNFGRQDIIMHTFSLIFFYLYLSLLWLCNLYISMFCTVCLPKDYFQKRLASLRPSAPKTCHSNVNRILLNIFLHAASTLESLLSKSTRAPVQMWRRELLLMTIAWVSE